MEKREVIYRHSGTVRITHWINVLVLLVLLMSGMQIFNAHPALYLGAQSNFDAPIFALDAKQDGDTVKGVTTVFGHSFDTDGVFGAATDVEGNVDECILCDMCVAVAPPGTVAIHRLYDAEAVSI
jgi:hypothetical protein